MQHRNWIFIECDIKCNITNKEFQKLIRSILVIIWVFKDMIETMMVDMLCRYGRICALKDVPFDNQEMCNQQSYHTNTNYHTHQYHRQMRTMYVTVVVKEKVIFKATPKGEFPVDRPRCCLRQCDTWQYDIYICICRKEILLICYNWVCNHMENPKSWKISFIFIITVLHRSYNNCYLIDCNATRTPWMDFYNILNIYNIRTKRNYKCIHIMIEIRWWSGYFQEFINKSAPCAI